MIHIEVQEYVEAVRVYDQQPTPEHEKMVEKAREKLSKVRDDLFQKRYAEIGVEMENQTNTLMDTAAQLTPKSTIIKSTLKDFKIHYEQEKTLYRELIDQVKQSTHRKKQLREAIASVQELKK